MLKGKTTERKYAILSGAAFALVALIALICFCLVSLGLGDWIELFNGATWPDRFKTAPAGIGFYLVLALRTFLNLGVVLSALLALFWFLTGGLERMIMKQIIERLERMRTAALVGEMLRVLEEADIFPPPDVEDRMYKVAQEFDESKLGTKIRRAQREPAE